jgi:hypothetical protein
MSVLLETKQRRLLSPEAVFGGRCRHLCYGNCGNAMVVPSESSGRAKLEEGDIWCCNTCGTLHEYYLAYAGGSRWATIRVLRGPHVRESGEPTVTEFMEKEKAA